MVRMLINLLLTLAANALGLIVAALVLDRMGLTAGAFFIAVGIFTLCMIVVTPMMQKLALKHARALSGSSALIAILVSLIITTIITDGMSIRGAVTWVLATIIIWFISMIGNLLLPWLFLRNRVENRAAAR